MEDHQVAAFLPAFLLEVHLRAVLLPEVHLLSGQSARDVTFKGMLFFAKNQ